MQIIVDANETDVASWTYKQGKRWRWVNEGRVFQVSFQERRLQARPDHQRGHQGRLRPLQGENQRRRVGGWTPGAGWVTLRPSLHFGSVTNAPLCTTSLETVALASVLLTRYLSRRFRVFCQCLYHPAKVAAAVFVHMPPKIRSLGLYFTWRTQVGTSRLVGLPASLFSDDPLPQSVTSSCSTVELWWQHFTFVLVLFNAWKKQRKRRREQVKWTAKRR